MKKLIVLIALAFVLADVTVNVMTIDPQLEMADCSSGGC